MVVFNEMKIKYEALDTLLSDLISNIKFTSNVNVIVDVKEILKKVFRPDIFPEIIINKGLFLEEIVSDIIGIISHYRNYFFKRGKYSSFYFIYSEEKCEEFIKIYPDYKKEYYEKYFDMTQDKSTIRSKIVHASKDIINKVPNCHFIDSSRFEDTSVVKFLKNKIEKNELTFLLSNDDFWFQCLEDTHIFALNCKGIKSQLLRACNIMDYISSGKNISFSAKLLPLVFSISGNSRYNLNNIKGIGIIKAINMVINLLLDGKISDTDYLEFPIKKEALKNTGIDKIILENFKTLSLNYRIITCNEVIYTHSTEIQALFNTAKTVLPENYFTELNAKLFNSYPLNLDMLFKGEI